MHFTYFLIGTADDELWPLIQKKLDILNKAGLSKDNFMDSESHSVSTASSSKEAKITNYFSSSFTEEDAAALGKYSYFTLILLFFTCLFTSKVWMM